LPHHPIAKLRRVEIEQQMLEPEVGAAGFYTYLIGRIAGEVGEFDSQSPAIPDCSTNSRVPPFVLPFQQAISWK
jgi:hypothetical protein